MKNIIYLLLLLFVAGSSVQIAQAQTEYTAQLSGQQESLPVLTEASGQITATLTGNILTVEGTFSNLSSNFDAAHIHIGLAGQDGDVLESLTVIPDADMRGGTLAAATNTFSLNTAEVNALSNRNFYINIHSTAHPSGEIRGQLLADNDAVYTATFSGSQEVPTVVSSGYGGAILELRGMQLVVSGAFTGLDSDFDANTGAHIHIGLAGANGPVSKPLVITVDADGRGGIIDPDLNSYILTEEEVTALQIRALYINIHSVGQPSGELRGQVIPQVTALFRAHLSGANENPAVMTAAGGTILAELNGRTLNLSGSFTGLSGTPTAAHIHIGFAGENGGVLAPLSITSVEDSHTILAGTNSLNLNDGDISSLFRRGFYINIHTEQHPSGELRGQLLPLSQTVFSTQLSGALLTPTIPTMATGALRAELQGNQLVVTGTLHNLSGALSTELEGGIIVHVGLAGTDGAVTFPLNGITTNEDAIVFESENNTILLSEVQRSNLISRRNYVQVYTRAYPTGELRGQWLPESTNYAVIQLSGTSVMPAVEDTGTGLLLVEINGEEVVFSGAFTDLSTDFNGSVQLYSGFAGTSGIIALELDAIGGGTQNGRFEPEANAYNLTPVLLEELYSRQMYVSLGAVGRTNGALRGQILPIATQYYTTYLAGANEVPGRTSSGFGNLKLELAGTRLTVTGSFGGLTSDYDPAVGSHLHLGRNGQNGAVLFPLTPMVSFDERSASYFAADNTFELNDEQITALRASEVYVNVHSIAQPTGELRGQVLPERLTFPTAVDSFALSEMMTFTIAGLPNEHFDFDWVASASAQSELLTYRWELAVEPTFDAPITFLETDTATIATLDLFTLDQLLEGLELAVDDELDLYQRVITSNGSLQKPSTVRLVRLRRGRVEPPAAYTAQLSGINEVLPVLTRATGRVSALLTNNTLEISGSFGNLSDTLLTEIAGGAHLHLGYAGQNGAVIRSLSITLDEDQKGGQFLVENNTFELTEQERTALLNRQLYINIHSAAFPNGELRGQLLPPNTEVYVANLSGSEEVPAVISGGRGAVVLDLQDTILTVSGSFDQLDGTFAATTGAHLHLGLAGQNGDVIFPLQITVAEDGKSGIIESQNNIYTIDITQSIALSLRNAYVNVHTDLHPTGELRGQIIEPALAVFRAHLSGTNEVPAVNTQANGQVIAELTTDNTLVISGTYNELSGNLSTDVSGGVHLHLGLAGQNGEVAIPLRNSVVDSRNGIFNSTNNSYPLTDTQVSTLLERGFYINLHSDAYPSGELRGQFLPASQVVFNGVLSGIFESPTAVNTAAHGQIKAELQGNLLTISGAYENLSADLATDLAGGAHIHLGLAGQNGDIEHLLRITETDLFGRSGLFLPSENTFELTDAQVAQIKNRQNYINIHSVAELSGEIRAQLLPEATTYLVAPLGGNSEVPPVQTDATGMAILEINGTTGTLTGTAQQLSGSFDANVAGGAHIHNGWAGRNGDILVGLVTDTLADSRAIEFMAAGNQFELTQGQIDSLYQRINYVNIHSTTQQSGELRGQLLPLATTYFTTTLSGQNEIPAVSSLATGAMKLELSDNVLSVSGSFSGLSSRLASEIAGGSHLHLGAVGQNGAVSFMLVPSLDTDSLSAVYRADSNTFVLNDDEVEQLRQGNYYVNIHSTTFQSGELRGQVLLENNFFPTNTASITNPVNGDTLLVAGRPTDQLTINWTAAQDSSQLAYRWQLATDSAFGTLLFEAPTGTALSITPTLEQLDTLLSAAGLSVGDSIVLYHRVIASDGSLQTAGETAVVTLIRGNVVAPSGYTAILTGHNEVLPIVTMASGRITAQLDGDSLTLGGRFDNLSGIVLTDLANGAHLHLGYAGQNGDLVQPLVIELDEDSRGGTIRETDNRYFLPDSLVTALNNGQIYINIHSAAFPDGELRAQLLPDADLSYQANLFGNNEVPTIMTQAHAALQLQVADSTLIVTGAFDNLEGRFDASIAGGAHLHIGMAGENGEVALSLNATVDADSTSGFFTPEQNTFIITDEQRNLLAQRNMYVNIHSTKFPSGELRGQIGEPSQVTFRAHLSGSNEVPAVVTTANGMVIAELIDESTLVVHGSFHNLESDFDANVGAHIHIGTAGENGGVAFPLVVELGADARSGKIASGANRFTLDATQRAALLERAFYINIHTNAQPAGALRGQLLPESQIVFNAYLAGIFEVNPVSTPASGAVKAELLGNQLRLSGAFANLSSNIDTEIAGGAHIHLGAAGQNGDLVFPLVLDLSADATAATLATVTNTLTLDEAQITQLRQRLNYINVHTTEIASGELRGQLLPEATTYFLAALGGTSEVPAVSTTATGMTLIEINGTAATLTGSFSGLSSPLNRAIAGGAHIHRGIAGRTGEVETLLQSESLGTPGETTDTAAIFRASDNQFNVSTGFLDTMRQRMHYVNIHSTIHEGGEIRGQLLPFGNAYFTTQLRAINEVEPIQSTANGALKIDVVGNQMTVTGSFAGLESDFASEIGAHLHIGGVGENGDVLFALTPSADSTTAARFLAANNRFELNDVQQTALYSGDLYANIHSANHPSGELRGQLLPEINFFPSAPSIATPADGSLVEIDTTNTTDFSVSWTVATDDNPLVYIWQLATDNDFSAPLINTNVGTSTNFSATQVAVDTLLGSAGIMAGDSVALFHRAIASDGSVQGIGETATVILKRMAVVEEDTMEVVDPPVVVVDTTEYRAQLSGSHEVLPVSTMANGEITAVLIDTVLTVSGRFDDLRDSVATDIANGAHIHLGYAGQNGELLFPLNITLDGDQRGGTLIDSLNQFVLDSTQMTALAERQLYINVHTKAFRGGELRGQLIPIEHELYTTNLFGNYEVPTVMSSGHGAAILDIKGDTLTVSGTFSELDGAIDTSIAGGAHLHFGYAGQNRDVAFPLTMQLNETARAGTFHPTDNRFILNSEQRNALLADNFYINLHTTAVASGELRGQVHDAGLATFRAHLSGSNEVPVVTTLANGMLIATLTDENTLVVTGSFQGLQGDLATDIAGGAHLHLGVAGTTGEVVFPLVATTEGNRRMGVFAKANNTFTLTSAQRTALYNREMYVNIHSEAHPAGELRGQLLPESQVVFNAHLSGIFEVTPVATKASGAVKVELLGNDIVISGAFEGLSSAVATEIAGGTHIHLGIAGRNGALEFPLDLRLNSGFTAGQFLANTNRFTLTDTQLSNLKARRNYINIHTNDFPMGELRGQLVPEATTYMLAALGGNSEVPAVDTDAVGHAIVEVNGHLATLTGSYTGLESAFNEALAGGAHLHRGYAGSNGDIAELVTSTPDSDTSGIFHAFNNQFMLADGLIDTLLQRGIYLNIHSSDEAGGEIRGQLLPLVTNVFTAYLSGQNEVPPSTDMGLGGLKLELTGNELTVTGSFNGLGSDFAQDIAGGAHLHLGTAAENGEVILLLQTTLSENGRSGFYAAADNTFELDSLQIAALCNGQLYANIHTEEFASGALRGQVLPAVNFFPKGSMTIVSPAADVDIITTNNPTGVLETSWESGTDRDTLVYIWQLAADSTFGNILIEEHVGFERSFATTLGAIDTLLAENGVQEGESILLYHRAIASDGSLQQTGESSLIRLVREEIIDADYVAILTGQSQVLPVSTAAYGEVYAELEDNQLILEGFFEQLSTAVLTDAAEGSAHIYFGLAGENGDIVFPIELNVDADGRTGVIEREANTFTLNTNQLARLANRQLYVNLRTEGFVGGEIRGQFLPIGHEVFATNLLGSHEVPSRLSGGHGALVLDLTGNQLTVSGTFAELEGGVDTEIGGGVHIHMGLPGRNGEVVLPLSADLRSNGRRGRCLPEDNTFVLSETQLAALRQHEWYVNVHTTEFATGELRGQITPLARAHFRAELSGSNEIPVVTSFATGRIHVSMTNDTTLVVTGTINDLSGEVATDIAGGAHLHVGYAGETGEVVLPLVLRIENNQRNASLAAEDNTFVVDETIRDLLYQRAMYANIHSTTHTAGELRGQLLPESQAVFNGFLSGIFEMPMVSTDALGGLKVELQNNQITVTGSFDGLNGIVAENVAGGTHLHIGGAGRNGDVILSLQADLDSDGQGGRFLAENNTFELTEEQRFRLIGREIYANIHTSAHPMGELRTQLLSEAATYFVAPLSGASVVPAANGAATGMIIAEVRTDKVFMSGSYAGLSSPIDANVAGGTHLHTGLAGQVGERIQILSPAADASGASGIFNVFGNTFDVDAIMIDNLLRRRQYIDIHTMAYRDGELRGQLLPLATTYLHTSLDGWNEVQPVSTAATGGLKLELTDNRLTVSGAFSNLTDDFDTSIGAHLHVGRVGRNGEVALPLVVSVSDDQRSGRVVAADNVFEIADSTRMALQSGELYANIHSLAFASGELRGQILLETNGFPSRSATISTPANGTNIIVTGAPEEPFRTTWTVATDRDELAYIWQLSADPEFTELLVNHNVGAAQLFETNFETLDMILANMGLELGERITLFHRAVATDGSNYTPGPTSTVNLERGTLVGINHVTTEQFQLVVQPNLVASDTPVQLQVTTTTATEGRVVIFNQLGQVCNEETIQIRTGINTYTVDIPHRVAGNYYLQLVVDGIWLPIERIVVQ